MNATIEITDLYGGEANYAWVRRYTLNDVDGLTDRQVVRRLKRLADLNGVKSHRLWYDGETSQYKIDGAYITFFITYEEY